MRRRLEYLATVSVWNSLLDGAVYPRPVITLVSLVDPRLDSVAMLRRQRTSVARSRILRSSCRQALESPTTEVNTRASCSCVPPVRAGAR